MNRELNEISDWAERAGRALWRVANMAKGCGVSVSTLERFFLEGKDQCPRDWLNAERMHRARELLHRQERIKHISVVLLYANQRNFTTAFTKFHGYPPRAHRDRTKNGEWSEHHQSELEDNSVRAVRRSKGNM